ncbi:490_t:CDS:2, partial [Ambispora gerdemannii]
MSQSNSLQEVPSIISQDQTCSTCHNVKKPENFYRSRGERPPQKFAACNQCSERRKNKCQETDIISRKKIKFESKINDFIPSTDVNNLKESNMLEDANFFGNRNPETSSPVKENIDSEQNNI